MNLASAFEQSVRRHPEKTAVFWGPTLISYAQLHTQTAQVTECLKAAGVKPGDRVCLYLKNRPEYMPAFLGVLFAEAVVVPINNFLKPDEMLYLLRDSGAKVIISESSAAEVAKVLGERVPEIKIIEIENCAHGSQPLTAPQTATDDLAVIIYTSGTTGRSKGAMLTHRNLLDNVESCRIVLQAVEGDRIVVLLPLFHSFMMTVGMLLPLLVGGSMVLIRSLHPPKNIIEEILTHGASILPAIPQFFRSLLHVQLPPGTPLRLCISGGAPLPVEILNQFNQKFSVPLLEGYGLSEASPVVSFTPIKGPWKAGSIGKPVVGVEVSIQDDEGNLLPVGQTGEVCVRGTNVMKGYWNQPEETAKCMRNGWLLTGDVGHEDTDGYFYITDRKKDMLLVNGINVYPREIEEVIYQLPGIKEAAVVGCPDHRKGEQPVAFIAPVEGQNIDEKQVLGFLKEKLADYKIPRKVFFAPALPRNATGKILKTELRKEALAKINSRQTP